MKFDHILNDIEKLALEKFAENSVQYNAVKKILLYSLYRAGTINEGENPNIQNFVFNLFLENKAGSGKYEDLGAAVSAKCNGILEVENAFKEIEGFKRVELKVGKDDKKHL